MQTQGFHDSCREVDWALGAQPELDPNLRASVQAESPRDRGLEPAPEAAPGDRPDSHPGLKQIPPVPTVNVWGTDFARLTMAQTVELADRIIQAGPSEFFITANLNYLMLIDRFPELRRVNRRSACILADGQPIIVRSRWSATPLPSRVAGSDLIVELAGLAARRGYRLYLLGGAPGVAHRAADELRRRFAGLRVAGVHAPPFRKLTAEEQSAMIEEIRRSQADILLVAFGQPKGELWIEEHLERLGVPLSIQLGASFDFLAGTAKRAPEIWRKVGCEWLYRALSDPRRLLPRYARNLNFLLRLLLQDVRDYLSRTGK